MIGQDFDDKEEFLDNEKNESNQKSFDITKYLFIIITIITAIFAAFGKLLTIGWITILLIFSFLPVHFILFIIAGILVANKKNKTKKDYICFLILCITLPIYTFCFVDVGDVGSSKYFYNIDEDILSAISLISGATNVGMIIYIFVRELNKIKI